MYLCFLDQAEGNVMIRKKMSHAILLISLLLPSYMYGMWNKDDNSLTLYQWDKRNSKETKLIITNADNCYLVPLLNLASRQLNREAIAKRNTLALSTITGFMGTCLSYLVGCNKKVSPVIGAALWFVSYFPFKYWMRGKMDTESMVKDRLEIPFRFYPYMRHRNISLRAFIEAVRYTFESKNLQTLFIDGAGSYTAQEFIKAAQIVEDAIPSVKEAVEKEGKVFYEG